MLSIVKGQYECKMTLLTSIYFKHDNVMELSMNGPSGYGIFINQKNIIFLLAKYYLSTVFNAYYLPEGGNKLLYDYVNMIVIDDDVIPRMMLTLRMMSSCTCNIDLSCRLTFMHLKLKTVEIVLPFYPSIPFQSTSTFK